MLLQEIEYVKFPTWGQGDWTAVDKIMDIINADRDHPIKMYHGDSYYIDKERLHRFQGMFYYEYPGVGNVIVDECPLELLKFASWYKCEPRTITNEKGIRLYIHWTINLHIK